MRPPDWAIRTKADEAAIAAGCYWSQEHADAITTFAERIFRPQYIGGKFRLLEWQTRFLQSLYGWRSPQGTRRFKMANLHISKKQGKTLLVSVISAYELMRSEDVSPFVATGSVSKENAAQVFNELKNTVSQPSLKKFCKITPHQKRIAIPKLNAEYRSLASDGDTAQGLNISACIIDEAHAHKNAGLYDSLRHSTIARTNGLLIVISTAGDDVTGFYHSIYSKSKRVLAGEDLDISHYAEVYEADAEADIDDREQWRKANPSLGVSFSEAQFALDLDAARRDVTELLRFRRYRLNQWVRPDEAAYFDVRAFDQGKSPEPEGLRQAPAWIGVDLSQTVDPSSISVCFALPGGRFYVRSWAWVARQGVVERNRSNLPRYEQFEAEGALTITPGDRIDDKAILGHLLDLVKRYRVQAVVFDPYSAFMMMGALEAEAVTVLRMSQTHRYYSGPMKDFGKAILEGRILHDGSAWLRYCLSNVRVDEARDGSIRPARNRSIDKIDGAIATLMAFSQAASAPAESRLSVYDQRGLMFID